MSKVLAELAERGLDSLNEPVAMYIDEATGFPVMRFGRGPITPEDVESILDDE